MVQVKCNDPKMRGKPISSGATGAVYYVHHATGYLHAARGGQYASKPGVELSLIHI